MTEQARCHVDEDGLNGCDGQIRQKHAVIKRLGGRIEGELVIRGE